MGANVFSRPQTQRDPVRIFAAAAPVRRTLPGKPGSELYDRDQGVREKHQDREHCKPLAAHPLKPTVEQIVATAGVLNEQRNAAALNCRPDEVPRLDRPHGRGDYQLNGRGDYQLKLRLGKEKRTVFA